MRITYYVKNSQADAIKARFGIYIDDWHLYINDLRIIHKKDGGWFIGFPSYKNKKTQKWENIVSFDEEAYKKFNSSARLLIEEYERNHPQQKEYDGMDRY